MKTLVRMSVLVFAIAGFALLVIVPPANAAASPDNILVGIGLMDRGGNPSFPQSIGSIANMLLFLLGAISVIAIIYGGFRFVTSGGNASSIKTARETIYYACIGLIVAIFSYAIVKFIIDVFA